MKRVFHRYLFREAGVATSGVTLTLLFILIATRFARYIGQAASGQLPRQLVFQLLGLSTLNYLVILIPGSVFIAVILTLGRLYRDNEMSAISACGISPIQTYRPFLALGLFLQSSLRFCRSGLRPGRYANRFNCEPIRIN
ncbi:putative permease YjgP/YjgQ [mine drainage metagenome]|uniref:Putative permease YjgP/YjgQ n=1 Tax=mine drainage metagenome TaxID=410659 RepID=T0YW66_9ZZZZ